VHVYRYLALFTLSLSLSLSLVIMQSVFCHSQVYDVSSYLDEHPGGDDVVLVATGNFLIFPSASFMI
jgi:hypothetical protein